MFRTINLTATYSIKNKCTDSAFTNYATVKRLEICLSIDEINTCWKMSFQSQQHIGLQISGKTYNILHCLLEPLERHPYFNCETFTIFGSEFVRELAGQNSHQAIWEKIYAGVPSQLILEGLVKTFFPQYIKTYQTSWMMRHNHHGHHNSRIYFSNKMGS